jgi:MFS transporter, DHA3 family, macrolide efflux protein
MTGFTLVWVGQVVSLLGANMTRFAITIWAWQETGQATTLALVGLFSFGPTVLLSPIAGALVDRLDRKLVMMLSDLAAGLATVALLALYSAGALEIWHLYLLGAWSGAFAAFQFPAYSAAISTMLGAKDYARASGMLALAESISIIAAPVLAGVLLGLIGVAGIFVIDIVTFTVAIGALLLVAIPRPPASAEGDAARGGLLSGAAYGFRFILARPALLHLQLLFTSVNFVATFGMVVLAPMVLARTGGDQLALASVHSALGAGGVAGGVLLSVWGGPRRRIHGVLLGMAGAGLLGTLPLGLTSTLSWWLPAAFASALFIPILNGANQAIWQAKVPPDVQGRVFAARRFIAQGTAPLAMLAVGPLADRVMEPAMAPGGALAGTFGPLVGVGPGAGMALMLVAAGLASGALGLSGYARPLVRDVEVNLPDHALARVAGGRDDELVDAAAPGPPRTDPAPARTEATAPPVTPLE